MHFVGTRDEVQPWSFYCDCADGQHGLWLNHLYHHLQCLTSKRLQIDFDDSFDRHFSWRDPIFGQSCWFFWVERIGGYFGG